MKPISPQLLALFDQRQFFMADLYQFTLQEGTILRYCAGDADVTWNGNLYPATGTYGTGTAGGPYFDRTSNKAMIDQKLGTEVDTFTVDILPGTATVLGESFLDACQDGTFDGAMLSLDRAFMPSYGDVTRGCVPMFLGRVAEIDCGRSIATFTVNSWLEVLNQQLPRNLWQPGCINNLGDSTCQVNLESFKTTLTITTSNSSKSVISTNISALPNNGYYDLGKVVFASGLNKGESRTIQTCVAGSPGRINLLGPFTTIPQAGDTFSLYAGCDKTSGIAIINQCTTTAGSNVLTSPVDQNGDPSTANILAGMSVFGNSGISANTVVTGTTQSTITLNNAATISAKGQSISFLSANGCHKFNNQARFRGFPYVPQPSMAS